MAIKYQFNKIGMQSLNKQLKIREVALPTLKSKESALRVTIKKQKENLELIKESFKQKLEEYSSFVRLWAEFPVDYFQLKTISTDVKKIAGIKTPVLKELKYIVEDFSRFTNPAWVTFGIEILKEFTKILTEIEIAERSVKILEHSLKKTMQKVNLYEKVQIPEYKEALRKIKRYLEDEENLDKAAQKITKQRQAAGG